jgi:hypothetical protein
MTDAEALDIAAAVNPRWRVLVETQPAEAWHNVRAIASGATLPPTPAAADPPAVERLLARVALCPHRTPSGCRCSGYCALGRGFPHPLNGRPLAALDDCALCPDLPD